MDLTAYFEAKGRGAKSALAHDLGITRTWMSMIATGRAVPSAALCIEIERLTGVKRELLRPDLFGAVL